jgi:predicted metal-dependent hydrolase
MNKRWGSCSANGQVTLNSHLIKAPGNCIEYVILHELAHLKYHDHGPEFWGLISSNMPGWQRAKKELDVLVELLTVE